jgi:NADPH2:quinone reductase
VVEAAGPAVTRVRPGDAVYFCDGGFGRAPGTYQEVKIVDERYLARKPARLSFAEAAAAPLVTITAWEALRRRAPRPRSRPGHREGRADPGLGGGLNGRPALSAR